jgi:hypothetical protein
MTFTRLEVVNVMRQAFLNLPAELIPQMVSKEFEKFSTFFSTDVLSVLSQVPAKERITKLYPSKVCSQATTCRLPITRM